MAELDRKQPTTIRPPAWVSRAVRQYAQANGISINAAFVTLALAGLRAQNFPLEGP